MARRLTYSPGSMAYVETVERGMAIITTSGVTVKHALYVGTSLFHASVMWNECGGTVCEHGHTRHH